MLKYIGIFLVLLVGAVIGATKCSGAELELGYGRAVIRGETDAAFATVVFPKQIKNIDLYVGAGLIGSYNYNDTPYSNQIVARAGFTANVRGFGVSLGLSTFQNEDRLNSGRLNFNLGLQYRYKNVVVHIWDHFSNAGSHSPNTGRDIVYVSYRFK